MTSPAASIAKPRAASPPEAPDRWLVLAAPVVALLAGMAAEWLDFRALRVPLLLMVGFGVLAHVLRADARPRWPAPVRRDGGHRRRHLGRGARRVYAIIHVAAGERFHAERFGPQWSQAIGLIAAHGLFLGVPTGIAAALMLSRRRSCAACGARPDALRR